MWKWPHLLNSAVTDASITLSENWLLSERDLSPKIHNMLIMLLKGKEILNLKADIFIATNLIMLILCILVSYAAYTSWLLYKMFFNHQLKICRFCLKPCCTYFTLVMIQYMTFWNYFISLFTQKCLKQLILLNLQ